MKVRKTETWAELAKRAGLGIRTIQRRVKERGMTVEQAVTFPVHQHAEHCQVLVTIGNKTQCIRQWLKELGVKSSTYYLRTGKYGMSPTQALLAYNVRNKKSLANAEKDRKRSIELGGNPNMIEVRRSRRKLGTGCKNWTDDEIFNTPASHSSRNAFRRIRERERVRDLKTLGLVV